MQKIAAHMLGEVVSSNTPEAHHFSKKNNFGEIKNGKIIYSASEVLFLAEEKKMEVLSRNGKIPLEELMKKFRRFDKRLQVKYPVFRDLRKKGYVVKTALKFGADFRVYDKGKKPGWEHAKWIVFADYESKRLTWHEFSAKNRVAHSTKKNLLLAIVDDEEDITYYEIKWIKP